MQRAIEFFRQPYFDTNDLRRNIRSFFVISLFVAFFLWFFKPFGLQEFAGNTLWLAVQFGLITFVVCILFELMEIYLLRINKEHPSWTFGRWLLSSVLLLLGIALGNFLFINYLNHWQNMDWKIYMIHIAYTVSIGIFPLFFTGLYSLSRHSRHFGEVARSMPKPVQQTHDPVLLTLPSRTGENLYLQAQDILFLEATQNYVTVCCRKNDGFVRHMIRNTFKEVRQLLKGHPTFIQAHRSYIVNQDHIELITGNSQGLLLHMDTSNVPPVPVSRTYIPSFR